MPRADQDAAEHEDKRAVLDGPAPLLCLAVAAALLRLAKGLRTDLIARDSVAYLEQSADALGIFSGYHPPLYPALLSLGSILLPATFVGLFISAVAGGCAVFLLGSVLQRKDARWAFLASLLLTILPLPVRYGGEVLSESLFLCLCLATVWALDWQGRRWLWSAVFIAAAALTRSEGLVIALALATLLALTSSKRALLGPWLALLLAILIPFKLASGSVLPRKAGVLLGGLARFSEERGERLEAVHRHFGAENASRQQLSPLPSGAEAAWDALLEGPALVLRKFLVDGWRALTLLPETVHPVVFVLALFGFVQWLRARDPPWALLVLALAQLIVVAMTRPSRRYLLPTIPLFVAAASYALLRLWLARRALAVTLMLIIFGSSLPIALRSERSDKQHIRALGRSLVGEAFLTVEPRVAFEAGQRAQMVPHWSSAAEARQWLLKRGLRRIVTERRWEQRQLPWLAESPLFRRIQELGPESRRLRVHELIR